MAVAVDASSQTVFVENTTSGAAITSATFSPPAGSLLLVAFPDENNAAAGDATATITDSLGSHLTWTKAVTENKANPANAVDAACSLFWASCPSSQTNMTVTVTPSGATSFDRGVAVAVLTGADTTAPVGASGVNVGTNSPQGITYTATAVGSMGFACAYQAFSGITTTAGTGTTRQAYLATASSNEYLMMRTSSTSAGLTSQTMQMTPSGAPSFAWAFVEILPATGGTTPFSYAGGMVVGGFGG